jgi:hypothetical protein
VQCHAIPSQNLSLHQSFSHYQGVRRSGLRLADFLSISRGFYAGGNDGFKNRAFDGNFLSL